VGIPFYVLITGPPNFIAMVMCGCKRMTRRVIRANESTHYRR
jgi:hypothetical protein